MSSHNESEMFSLSADQARALKSAPAGSELSRGQKEAGWQAIQSRLAAQPEAVGPVYRRLMQAAAALLVVAALPVYLFLIKGGEAVYSAGLQVIAGTVSVDGRPAGKRVKAGQTITAPAGSHFTLRLEEDSLVDLKGPARVTLSDEKRPGLELHEGELAAVVRHTYGKKENSDHQNNHNGLSHPESRLPFTVTTANASFTVTGTVFFIKSRSTETYFCICNGHIDVGYNGQSQPVSAAHHAAYNYSRLSGSVEMTPAGMLYHIDPFLEKLAGQTGAVIDWTTAGSKRSKKPAGP